MQIKAKSEIVRDSATLASVQIVLRHNGNTGVGDFPRPKRLKSSRTGQHAGTGIQGSDAIRAYSSHPRTNRRRHGWLNCARNNGRPIIVSPPISQMPHVSDDLPPEIAVIIPWDPSHGFSAIRTTRL